MTPQDDEGALFVGRISREKGVEIAVEAWRQQGLPLRIAGDGPLFEQLRSAVLPSTVELLGRQTKEQVFEAMKRAQFLVMPSVWYEGFPMVIVEAFAHGLPVVCSRLGGMAEVVEDGVTGLHFEPGDAADLADKVAQLSADPERCRAMGRYAPASRANTGRRRTSATLSASTRTLQRRFRGSLNRAQTHAASHSHRRVERRRTAGGSPVRPPCRRYRSS